MPRLGGGAVRDRLRATRHDLPILLATGYGSDQLPRGFAPGACERLIRKPWTTQELLGTVQDLLEGPGAPQP